MKNRIIFALSAFALASTLSFDVAAKKKEKKEDPLLVLEFEAPEAPKKSKNKKMTKEEKALAKQYKKVNEALKKCTFEVSAFEDKRQNKQTIGSTFWKALKVAPVDKWLSDVSTSMLEEKLKTDTVGVRRIVVEPKLTRMYSYAQNMNIHGVVALHVDFREEGKLIESRHYRALGSTINWNNGDHEFLDAVNISMKEVMPKVLFSLPSICDSKEIDFTPHELK